MQVVEGLLAAERGEQQQPGLWGGGEHGLPGARAQREGLGGAP
ncbi:MAG: hypothetical protein ACRDOY_12275 [Nocardioidaceae bacterium]